MFKTLLLIIIFFPLLLLFFLIYGYFFNFKLAINKSYDFPSKVQGIAVLTGGKGRIEKALSIFNTNPKSKLLISGVHKKVSLDNIINSSNYNKDSIFIDKASESTLQNAAEIVKWAENNSLDDVLIITSYYHMPRSMALLNYFGKNINFFPIPVKQKNFSSNKIETNIFLFEEYLKYLLTSSFRIISN